MELSVSELEELVSSAFENEGFSDEETKISTDEIVDAHCRGRTTIGASYVHNLKGWKDGSPEDIEIVGDSETHRLIEGNGAVGTYVSVEAMDLAMDLADSQGVGVVGVNNPTPFLAAGYNPRRAANEGYIGINWCNGQSTVAMYGGAEPVYGTNPLGVGIPADDIPIVLDIASSKIANADVSVADELNEELPENTAISNDGEPTRDPSEAKEGALLPFGEHKGSGLGFIIELLSGAFVNGKVGTEISGNVGMVFIAMKPDLFTTLTEFDDRVSSLISEANSSSTLPGFDEVYYPGQHGELRRRECLEDGVEVRDDVYESLVELAK